MHSYLINLARRPDRLAKMQAQLETLGLPFTRIEAVDGVGEDDIGHPPNHPLTKPEYACYLSHIKAYRAFLDSGESHCLILEDDVQLSRSLPGFLARASLPRAANSLIRLEAPTLTHWGRPALCLPKPTNAGNNIQLFRLLSNSNGTGAFILPRALARRIVENNSTPQAQIDVFLFHRRSAFSSGIKIWQSDPALALQWQFSAPDGQRDSDIISSRKAREAQTLRHDPLSVAKRNFRRNIKGIYYTIGRITRLPFKNFPFIP